MRDFGFFAMGMVVRWEMKSSLTLSGGEARVLAHHVPLFLANRQAIKQAEEECRLGAHADLVLLNRRPSNLFLPTSKHLDRFLENLVVLSLLHQITNCLPGNRVPLRRQDGRRRADIPCKLHYLTVRD